MKDNIRKDVTFEEVDNLIKKISSETGKLRKLTAIKLVNAINFVYIDGMGIGEAYYKAGFSCSKRAIQRLMKRKSNGLITFRDLKRAYRIKKMQTE
jgi:hypothetical protein